MSDNYAVVTATCLSRTAKSVLLEIGDKRAWVPLSLIHGADEPKVQRNVTMRTRVMAWKVREIEKGATDDR